MRNAAYVPRSVLIYGAGQVAEVFADYLGSQVAGMVVDPGFDRANRGQHVVHESTHIEDVFSNTEYEFIVGLSFKGLNKPRAEKFEAMNAKGFKAHTHIDRDYYTSTFSKIGIGSFIMDGNTIQTGVEIGENCVLWSGNHCGHHSRIGNNVWLSSGIVVSGACEIGDYTFVGSGVTIVDGVKIGARCIIGAGSLVLRDVPDDSVVGAEGTPISKVSSARATRLLG